MKSYKNSQYSIWKFRRFAGNDFSSNQESEHVFRVLEAFEKVWYVSRNDVTRDVIARVIGDLESRHPDGYMHETIICRMPLGLRSYHVWFVWNWAQTKGKKASIHVCMYICMYQPSYPHTEFSVLGVVL